MRLNSDQANKWLTLLANFGVVLGLALLIYELRQSQNLAETQAAVRRLDQMQIAQVEFATSEFIAPIKDRAQTEGVDSLTSIERRRLVAWERSVILRMRSQYTEYIRGFLDEETANTIIAAATRSLPYWEELGLEDQNTVFFLTVRKAADIKSL